MNQKVLGSVFVLAVALGMTGVAVRTPAPHPTQEAAAKKAALTRILRDFNVTPGSADIALRQTTDLARPLSCYQVRERGLVGGMEYKTMAYTGQVSEDGFRYGNDKFEIALGTPRLVQNGSTLESHDRLFVHSGQAEGEVRHGSFDEKYLFENKRVEQIFTIPAKVGSGALEMRVPVTSPLPGNVIEHRPEDGGFRSMEFQNGGLAFQDAGGVTRLAVHGAIAMDASGLRAALTPRFENRDIVLGVPASFMDRAVYPVVIDPWFDLAGSGTGGGLSNNAGVSDRPAMVMSGSGLPWVAWSDNTFSADNNNTDIYVAAWTGFQWISYAGGLAPGGISNNPGKSTNPSICLGDEGFPFVAWQDDSNGYVQIYVKIVTSGTGGWTELLGSASGTGISRFVGPMQHPSIASLTAVIPGSAGTPTDFKAVPVVAYEDASADSNIVVMIYYPGQPSVVPVPEGWYQLTSGGSTSNKLNFGTVYVDNPNPNGLGVSEWPSLVIDSLGNPVVAWQESMDGNYEIYVKTYPLNAGGFFRIDAVGLTGQTIVPSGVNWVGISGSASPGGISATATMSQYPSIAVDTIGNTNNISVAWQETLPVVPGTSSQIYVKRSVGGGAFAQLAGSATGLGISSSTSNATTPSLASGGNYLAVAWSDDSSGNPEIYARRFSLNPLSTQWEQIGFQGSAFPLVGADVFAPPDGLSKTPTYSLKPCVQVDNSGNPTVAWLDGLNATFDVYVKQFSPNGPGVATGANFTIQMRQTDADPTTTGVDIPVGGTTPNTTVFLSTRVFTENLLPAGSALRTEFEVKPFNAPFTGTNTVTSLPVVPDTTSATPANISVFAFTGLSNYNYHWQARSVDQVGRHSPWFAFGTIGNTSFQVNTGATGGGPGGGGSGPPPPTVVAGNTRSKGSCGLLGLEAAALLGLLRILRRRRAT